MIGLRSSALSAALVLVLASGCSSASTPQVSETEEGAFPEAGFRDLEKSSVATGVDFYQGSVPQAGIESQWVATAVVDDRIVLDAGARDSVMEDLQSGGLKPEPQKVTWPEGAAETGSLGWIVRIPADSEDDAESVVEKMTATGVAGKAEWTGFDPGVTSETRVSLLVVDPKSTDFEVRNGATAAVPETVLELGQTKPGSLASVNASYFVMPEDPDNATGVSPAGFPGAPAGASVVDGTVEGLPVANRPAVQFTSEGPQFFTTVSSQSSASIGADTSVISGANRMPGNVTNCGAPLADGKTQASEHDKVCAVEDDLVLLTDNLGVEIPKTRDPAYLIKDGTVTGWAAPGSRLQQGETALLGTGKNARWLKEKAIMGTAVSVTVELQSEGQAIDASRGDLVSGGPMLVSNSEALPDSSAGGFAQADDPSQTFGWVLRKVPRTAIAELADGRIALIVADGRQAGRSAGFGIPDFARFVRSLGARNAVNLDGGGSSTMVVGDEVVNKPSDETGPRKVGDAISIVPAGE